MDRADLRQALTAFLGPERFRKFMDHLRSAERLRVWQEDVWARFTLLHPEFVVGFDELQAALRICELHGCELKSGAVGVFRGCKDHTNRYIEVRNQLFPHAASEVSAEGASFAGNEVRVWYCPDCRVAEASWKEGLQPMVTIADLLARREQFPLFGVPAEELVHIMGVVATAREVVDKRVMYFRLYSDGHLLIHTGEQRGGCFGGGDMVLLRKDGEKWVLVEVSRWLS
jgi:hypothetical protein